jgi:hypothetical protein
METLTRLAYIAKEVPCGDQGMKKRGITRTWPAKRSEHSVSPAEAGSGFMLTNLEQRRFHTAPRVSAACFVRFACNSRQQSHRALLANSWSKLGMTSLNSHERLAVAAQARLQQVRQLRVAIGNVRLLAGQRVEHVAQARQALVDVARLTRTVACRLAAVSPAPPPGPRSLDVSALRSC